MIEDYNPNEIVIMSLERYEEMKSQTDNRLRQLEIFDIAIKKLTELGYVIIYHEQIYHRPEIMLKSDWEKTEAGQKELATMKEFEENNKKKCLNFKTKHNKNSG